MLVSFGSTFIRTLYVNIYSVFSDTDEVSAVCALEMHMRTRESGSKRASWHSVNKVHKRFNKSVLRK